MKNYSNARTACELRELATRLDQVGRESAVWSIVYPWVMTLTNHLEAVARIHEVNEERKNVVE